MVRHGQRVRPGRKSQKKPIELLRLLVERGPHGISRADAADALWPDSEGDAALHALGTTAYRLRKLLGSPDTVIHNEGRVALDPRRVFVEAWHARPSSDGGVLASGPTQARSVPRLETA